MQYNIWFIGAVKMRDCGFIEAKDAQDALKIFFALNKILYAEDIICVKELAYAQTLPGKYLSIASTQIDLSPDAKLTGNGLYGQSLEKEVKSAGKFAVKPEELSGLRAKCRTTFDSFADCGYITKGQRFGGYAYINNYAHNFDKLQDLAHLQKYFADRAGFFPSQVLIRSGESILAAVFNLGEELDKYTIFGYKMVGEITTSSALSQYQARVLVVKNV